MYIPVTTNSAQTFVYACFRLQRSISLILTVACVSVNMWEYLEMTPGDGAASPSLLAGSKYSSKKKFWAILTPARGLRSAHPVSKSTLKVPNCIMLALVFRVFLFDSLFIPLILSRVCSCLLLFYLHFHGRKPEWQKIMITLSPFGREVCVNI